MRLCFFALFLIACSAVEAQRVYYQAGFPPAPGRHLFLANRQRTRFANGFSARLQQSTDETDEQDTPTGTNSAGGIGVVNGSGDSESNDNGVDDAGTTGSGDSQSTTSPGSTKSSTSTTTGGGPDIVDDSSETTDDTGSSDDGATTDSSSGDTKTSDGSAEDTGDTSTTGGDESEGGVDNRATGNGKHGGGGSSKGHGSDDGSYDHGDHGDTIDWLKDAVQGEPGKDYPIFSEIPQTGFKCSDQKLPGYYGDVEAKCQVFHICQADGRMDSFLCPNGTIFAQNYFVCVWWHDFDCSTTESFYNLNENLYKPGKGIDGSDVLISPLDMMNGLVPMMLGGGSQDSDSSGEIGGGMNSMDGSSNNAIDESNEGDKVNSKTNTNEMGFTDSGDSMNNFSPSSNPTTNNNGMKGKTNLSKTNGNGKTSMLSPGGMMGIIMRMGKTNGNGNTKTPSITTRTPLTTTSAPIDDSSMDDQTDNEISEPASTEMPSNVSERPDSSSTDSGEGETNDNVDNAINNTPEDDGQRNIEDNEVPADRAQSTTNLPSDNSITDNPAAEEVTDTPIEGGVSSEEDSGKDEPSTTDEPASGQQEDVQITEKDDGTSSAVRSRARFLLYKPRFRSAQLARVRVNPKKARFLPVLSSRNGVTRRLAGSNPSNNRKRSKRLRGSSNSRRSSLRRKSSRSSSSPKRGGRRSSQLRLKKKSKGSQKKATTSKKKNLKNSKRANNRRKQTRSNSNSRRRGGSRRSRSQRRTNRRLIVLRNAPLRKHHN